MEVQNNYIKIISRHRRFVNRAVVLIITDHLNDSIQFSLERPDFQFFLSELRPQ